MSVKNSVGGIEALGTLVALLVVAVFLFQWGLEGAVHNRPIQMVPDLRSKSISGALDALAPFKLALSKEGSEFNSSVPIGSILRQRPPAGTKVREGKIIKVVVSQGGETVFTPSTTGLPLRNAEMLLRQNQLALGEVTESYSLRLEKGLVLSQDPQAETSVERNSMVNVVVSAGPPPEGIVLMPDFLHKNTAEASQWASENGIAIAFSKDMNSLFPSGTILKQEPASDAAVDESAQIRLTISGRAEGKGSQAAQVNFHYQVPQGSSEALVRILLVDQDGERELFAGLRAPGSKIDLSIPPGGRARVKIFLNGILVEERDL